MIREDIMNIANMIASGELSKKVTNKYLAQYVGKTAEEIYAELTNTEEIEVLEAIRSHNIYTSANDILIRVNKDDKDYEKISKYLNSLYKLH